MKISLFYQQSQKMFFTQSMKQGLHLLKLNSQELEDFLDNEIDQNPFLEKIPLLKKPPFSDTAAHISRYEYLIRQAKMVFNKNELSIAETIIGNLDERGFYPYYPKRVQEKDILKTIQTFDPIGIAAFNLRESLLFQMENKPTMNKLAYAIIKDHYEEFLHKKWDLILKKLSCKKQDFFNAIYKHIAYLNFAPGKGFDNTYPQLKSIDLVIQRQNKKLQAVVCDPIHFKMVNPFESYTKKEEIKWVNRNKKSIYWLIKNLENRKQLLTHIGKVLIEYERGFFEWESEIQPISVKQTAIQCNVHPTTIHRMINNKYVKCSRGIFPLKIFFKKSVENTSGENLSNEAILQKIQKLIQKESKEIPLSDQKIVANLQMQGIKIARRTVAKYRNLLKIPTKSYRKKTI